MRVVWLGCREAPMTVGILVRERQNRRRTRMSGVAQPAVQELELRLNAYKGGQVVRDSLGLMRAWCVLTSSSFSRELEVNEAVLKFGGHHHLS